MIPEIDKPATAAQYLMTMSAMAYAQPDDIAVLLEDPSYATQGDWTIVWGPATTDANLMYVVKRKNVDVYAVVIRGTVLSFSWAMLLDLYEDLDVGNQVSWLFPPVPGAMVANGTMVGLEDLLSMASSGFSLLDYMNTLPTGSYVFVTGHSLGGCLTTVLAPWLQTQLAQSQQVTVSPFTFAAPTAGNAAFASWYDNAFTMAWRYYNDIDMMPMAWSALLDIDNLYAQPGPPCPDVVQGVIDLIALSLTGYGYTQTDGTGSPLTGSPTPQSDWVLEVATQHSLSVYLALVGAPPVNISNMAPECLLRPAHRERLGLAAMGRALAA